MTPTKESILAKHLSTDHALQSGKHLKRDMIYEAMVEAWESGFSAGLTSGSNSINRDGEFDWDRIKKDKAEYLKYF